MRGGNVIKIRETPAWRHAAYADVVIRQGINSDASLFRARLETDAPGRRILELGCGAGGILLYLAEHGYDVHGIDGNPAVLAALRGIALERGLSIETQLGFIEQTEQLGEFDAVILASVLMNAGDYEYRARLLSTASTLLSSGGLLLIEHCDAAFFAGVGQLLEEQQDLICQTRSGEYWVGEIHYKFPDLRVIVPTEYHLIPDAGLAAEAASAGFARLGSPHSLNMAARLSVFRRRTSS